MTEQGQEPTQVREARIALQTYQQKLNDVEEALSRFQEEKASAERNLEVALINLPALLAREQIGWPEEGPVNLREERKRLHHSKRWLADLEMIEPVLIRWLTRYEELATNSADHLVISEWEQRQHASQS